MRGSSLIFIVVLLLLGFCVCGCTQQSQVPIPRRTAYARVAEYDSVYTVRDSLPMPLLVNAQAVTSIATSGGGPLWLNISYPKYRATAYCTFTPVTADIVQSVIDNRIERFQRNIGSAASTVKEFPSASGWPTVLVTSPGAVTTPVQFVAASTDDPMWVFSGTVFFEGVTNTTPMDSVMPMVAVITRDLEVMLQAL